MTFIFKKNLSSKDISTYGNAAACLLSTTAYALLLSATSVQALPNATVTNSAGAAHNNIIADVTAGVKVDTGDVGVNIITNTALSGSMMGIVVDEIDAGQDVEVTANHDVTSSAGWGVWLAGSHSGKTIFNGTGNISSVKDGISIHGESIALTGTGSISTNATGIYAKGYSGTSDVVINYSGAINITSATSGLAGVYGVKTGGTGDIIINTGPITSNSTGFHGIYTEHSGAGDTNISTNNAIIISGNGDTSGVRVTTASGNTDITVSDITSSAASIGSAIILSNSANSTNGSNVTLNGIINGGDAAAGFKAIKANGNTAVGFNLTNNTSATLNGLVDANGWNVHGSKFINSGTWNAFGGISNFSGAISNTGTIDLQNNQTSDGANFDGNITFASTSILKVDVDKGGAIDRIKTSSGNVTLGGTLDVNATGAEASYMATSGIVYTLIDNTGTGTTSGDFLNQIDNLAFLSLEVNAAGGDGNDVTFKFVNESIDFKPHATGENQMSAATAMDGFDYSSTDGADLKTKFLGLTNDESKQTISQLGGDDYLASLRSAAPIAQEFQSAMMDGANKVNAASKPIGFTVTATGDLPAASIELWAKAVGSYSKVNSTITNDLTTKNLGVFGGSDYLLNDDLTVGVSAGYTNSNFSVLTAGSNSKANNFHLGASVRHGATAANEAGLGVAMGANVTKHMFNTKRVINIGAATRTASANYSGVTLGAVLTGRYGFNVPTENGNIVIAPFFGVDGSRTHNNAFTETGAGTLNISTAAKNSNQLGTLIGFGVAGKVGNVDAGISAGWRHEFGDVNYTNVNTLAGSSATFTRTTPTEARNKVILKADISFKPSPNSQVTFTALGEKSHTSINLGINAGFKLKF